MSLFAKTPKLVNDPTVEAYFEAVGFVKTQFVRFRDSAVRVHPIEAFTVLYKGPQWTPRAPSPYEPLLGKKTTPPMFDAFSHRGVENVKDVKEDGSYNKFGTVFKEDNIAFAQRLQTMYGAPTKEAKLRALVPEKRGYEKVLCAVLVDRVENKRYVIPQDGFQRAMESEVADLFLKAYPTPCRPPKWPDADKYATDPKVIESLKAAMVKYAVGSTEWNRLSWKVYAVGESGAVSLSRRLPCDKMTDKELSELTRFGYTKSGFQESGELLSPVSVYVRTPFVGVAKKVDDAELNRLQAEFDAKVETAKTMPRESAVLPTNDEEQALLKAKQARWEAMTPTVSLLDVVNVSGPVLKQGSREFEAVMGDQDREAWIRQRLEKTFDAINYVAEKEEKDVVVMGVFGSAPDWPPLGLEKSYADYFDQVMRATMKKKVVLVRDATLPQKIEEYPDALFVNDMGPDYVVGNCNFADKTTNGYFGSRSAMAFLTHPAVNPRITVKVLPPVTRTYTAAVPAPKREVSKDEFNVPENDESDYTVAATSTLESMGVEGDELVRKGYVPCGGVIEVDNVFYQAFVRLQIDHLKFWALFQRENHMFKN